MFAKANSVDIGQPQQYSSASGYWQEVEEGPLEYAEGRYGVFLKPQFGFVVSANIYLPFPEITHETATALLDVDTPKLTYRNREAVETYLARYPEIESFIEAAYPALVESFGSPVDIVLEVITHPDETAHQELVGWIQSTDSVVEGLEKYDNFEDEWFLDHMYLVDDKFNFNIETK
jgi:hypothetical protein